MDFFVDSDGDNWYDAIDFDQMDTKHEHDVDDVDYRDDVDVLWSDASDAPFKCYQCHESAADLPIWFDALGVGDSVDVSGSECVAGTDNRAKVQTATTNQDQPALQQDIQTDISAVQAIQGQPAPTAEASQSQIRHVHRTQTLTQNTEYPTSLADHFHQTSPEY